MRLLRDIAVITIVGAAAGAQSVTALTPPIPPLAGPYKVQPGGVVLACGGFDGSCRALTLEGTLYFDAGFTELRIAQSDLRLRGDHGATQFPGSNDLSLVGLTGPIINDGDSRVVELAADGPHGQRVDLELHTVGVTGGLVGNLRLALRGTYDEGCCDRYVYDFGNVRLEPDLTDGGLLLGPTDFDFPRFVVSVRWTSVSGSDKVATSEQLGPSHGYFWFYSADNPEIFVKMVSACSTPHNRVWFFASGLTNLGVLIEVMDRSTFITKTYINPIGSSFAPILDTGGFPCLPVS
jgi:hypothetical protein